MNNLSRIDSLLNDISKKNDKAYLSHFIFHLYNYEEWFLIKKIEILKLMNLIK